MLKGEHYKHYKGNIYKILEVATHSETNETLVVYQSADGKSRVWARPFEMFSEIVKVGSVEIPRFKKVNFAGENFRAKTGSIN